MINRLIKERVELISYSQTELSNIAITLSNLKSIINNEPEFKEPFLGGSYKRATMVKGISDVDVYFRYFGNESVQNVLSKLKSCLIIRYPNTSIKQDKPSILADFNKIPINITPYKEDQSGLMSIPNKQLNGWEIISFGYLEKSIISLRQKNSGFIDLIKILKLWNRNYNRGIKNFEIEKRVVSLFLNNVISSQRLCDWVWIFLKHYNYQSDANNFYSLFNNNYSDSLLRAQWNKFIDNN
ncbi:MAG: hypothetical protein MUO72_16955 [Bacteroidales bacterium]|nr:hypothetical protein [Bacteroidales bacterium]